MPLAHPVLLTAARHWRGLVVALGAVVRQVGRYGPARPGPGRPGPTAG